MVDWLHHTLNLMELFCWVNNFRGEAAGTRQWRKQTQAPPRWCCEAATTEKKRKQIKKESHNDNSIFRAVEKSRAKKKKESAKMSEVNTTREAYDISTRRDNSQYTFLLLCIQEELKLNKKSFVFSPFRSRQWKTVSVSLLTCLRIEWKSFLPRAVSLLCIIKLSENKICVIFFLHWEKLLAIEIYFFLWLDN